MPPAPNVLPAKPADGEAAIGPRVYGVVDVLRASRVAGWAIDRSDSAASVEVEIRREGRLVETVRADRPRRDLERSGVGTGRYGFVCELSPPLQPGFEFTVSATARTGDGMRCELRRAGADDEASGERRLVERIFEIVSRPATSEIEERIEASLARLEVAQARIEAALTAVEPPEAPALTGLRIVAGVALGTALVSLTIGAVSMLL
jgi:hypothetical protein